MVKDAYRQVFFSVRIPLDLCHDFYKIFLLFLQSITPTNRFSNKAKKSTIVQRVYWTEGNTCCKTLFQGLQANTRRERSTVENLEQRVKAYYEKQSLPEEKVSRILVQAEQLCPSKFVRPAFSLAIATAAVIFVGTVLFWTMVVQRPTVTDQVIAEIATIHQHVVGVEVASDRYDILQAKLPQLTFSILPTQPYLLEQFELLGGRYSSIQGNMAAQLTVKERRSGILCTVYVTSLTPDLQPLVPRSTNQDGIMVKIWEDHGRLFGLAGEMSIPDSSIEG